MTRRILVVDGSKLARIVAARNIRALRPDWVNMETRDADDAVAVLATQSADAVLLDLDLPGRIGLAVARELRDLYPGMWIAIATTVVQDCLVAEAGAMNVRVFEKPMTAESLRAFMNEIDDATSADDRRPAP